MMLHARGQARRWEESVDVYSCKQLKKEVYPGLRVEKGADMQKVKAFLAMQKVRCQLTSVINKFRSLPRRESFSGLHLASEIDRLQKQLTAMGDKNSYLHRFHPEISIEMGGEVI